MTLQQLRYLIAVAEFGSINAAAHNLYSSQSNLSTAIKDLENELGITIFRRNNRGVTLTNEGTELLGYARQVVEQADMLEERYARTDATHARLAVSTQHYAFSVQAFVQTAAECASDRYEFILRETATGDIISDVRDFRSEIGILFTDSFNSRVLWKAFDDANLMFHPLFEANVHVFVGAHHPLSKREIVTFEDLEPYPRYSFEQGQSDSFFFAEEPFAHLPHARSIRMSDRGTLSNLLTSFDGYTLSTGVLSSEMERDVVSIPVDTSATMQVGYVIHRDRKPSALLLRYIEHLKRIIQDNPSVTSFLAN